jgi:C_GCAxxG_C_C family probable redox protein
MDRARSDDEESTMRHAKEALNYFDNGSNCAQSVLAAYAEQFGLDQETALKIAACFGGGVANRGQTCGAVCGALMVIGLRYGNTDPADAIARKKKYASIRQFMEGFTASHHSTLCRELLGCEISTPEGRQQAEEQNLFATRCPPLLQTATELLDDVLEQDTPRD